jgi:hypothetical protein
MDDHTFPASLGLHLAELVKRWDVTAGALLEESRVPPAALRDLRARFSTHQVVAVLERPRHPTGEPALGLYLGTPLRVPRAPVQDARSGGARVRAPRRSTRSGARSAPRTASAR